MAYIKTWIDNEGKYCGDCRDWYHIPLNGYICKNNSFKDERLIKTGKGILRCKQCLDAEVKE